MAIWQFDLHCLPRRTVVGQIGELPLTILPSGFDDGDWWRGEILETTLADQFSQLLPKAQSWSPKIQMWGQENGDRIDLASDDATIQDVLVRIDVRNIDYKFLMSFIQCADANNWVLLTQDNYVLVPSLSRLLSAIRRSDSFQFVADPHDFLKRLKASSQSDCH